MTTAAVAAQKSFELFSSLPTERTPIVGKYWQMRVQSPCQPRVTLVTEGSYSL